MRFVPLILELVGWAAISAGAFRVSTTVGLFVGGASAIAIAYMAEPPQKRAKK